MKWIRTVVTVVIMIVSVGVIALGINNLTQERVKEEVVTFELLENNELAYNVFDTINEFAIYDNNEVINLVSIIVNDDYNIFVTPRVSYFDVNEYITIIDRNDNVPEITIKSDSTYNTYDLNIGDIISITFGETQPPILTGTIAIILGLVPLIVASGVLYFMLRKNNLGD